MSNEVEPGSGDKKAQSWPADCRRCIVRKLYSKMLEGYVSVGKITQEQAKKEYLRWMKICKIGVVNDEDIESCGRWESDYEDLSDKL